MARDGTQVINPGYKPYYNTGSDELPAICLERGVQSSQEYGVSTQTYGGPCPRCQVSIQIVLDFNAVDGGHFYGNCPICNYRWKHLNPDGSFSDFKEVIIPKNPILENEMSEGNPPGNGWY